MAGKNKLKFFILLAVDALLVAFSIWMAARPDLHFGNFALLNPHGIIALQERSLMITAILIMLVAVIPAFALLFFIAWKYRAGKTEVTQAPDPHHNLTTTLIWGLPTAIILILGVINWQSTHALDPYKPIASNTKAITIQVVALQWKWLFIYPDFNIATVNFIAFPKNTPLNFELTADNAPMNSFWIPQLGGQMYAMTGMSTKLHLMAGDEGNFNGSAAEISGQGFAGMRFVAKSTSKADFDAWVKEVKKTSAPLDQNEYSKLAGPSENNTPVSYSSVEKNLFNNVMAKYMAPMEIGGIK